MDKTTEACALCGCILNRSGEYATPSVLGRSHATKHHFVAERFFGRTKNRRAEKREGIFLTCPWGYERKTAVYCYECHEELLHNPVLLPADILAFAELVKRHGLHEEDKTENREKIAGRVRLMHEVIVAGLKAVAKENRL